MPEMLDYDLALDPALEPYRPEIEHACDFVERGYFVRRRSGAHTKLYYGTRAPADGIHVPAALFPAGVRLDADGIHLDRREFAAIEQGRGPAPLLPGPVGVEPGPGRLDYDALGLIFFLLSRIEERGAPQSDHYGRFPAEAALTLRQEQHHDPLADRAAFDLARLLTGESRPISRTRYEVALTHDVDRLKAYHRPFEPLRLAAGDLLKRGRPMAAFRRFGAYISGEPWRSFRELMELSERYGLKSRFYFMGPSRLAQDSPYTLTMTETLKRVTDEVTRRGHAIGFHPGFATAENANEWRRQREGLETAIGARVREGRQHVLRYRAERTPDIWEAEGMVTDYTLGFPGVSGFRSGTCRPFNAYSLRRRRTLTLEQCATAIMDFGLFGGKYRDLTVERALEECRPAISACRRYGGRLVVLYHSGQSAGPVRRFYERLLQEAVS